MSKIKAIIAPVVEEAGKFVETAKEQVTLADSNQSSGDDTKRLVEDIYKPGETKSPEEIAKNQVKDKAKLEKTRAKLRAHQEYFQNLTNPPKQKEEPVAKKIEREKMQDLQSEQEKQAKKPPPIAVQRGQRSIESQRGSSG